MSRYETQLKVTGLLMLALLVTAQGASVRQLASGDGGFLVAILITVLTACAGFLLGEVSSA